MTAVKTDRRSNDQNALCSAACVAFFKAGVVRHIVGDI